MSASLITIGGATSALSRLRQRLGPKGPPQAKLLHLEEPWNRRTTSLARLDSSEVRLVPESTPSLPSEVSHMESSVDFNCNLSVMVIFAWEKLHKPLKFPAGHTYWGRLDWEWGESSSFRSDGAAEALVPAFSCRENIPQMETDEEGKWQACSSGALLPPLTKAKRQAWKSLFKSCQWHSFMLMYYKSLRAHAWIHFFIWISEVRGPSATFNLASVLTTRPLDSEVCH